MPFMAAGLCCCFRITAICLDYVSISESQLTTTLVMTSLKFMQQTICTLQQISSFKPALLMHATLVLNWSFSHVFYLHSLCEQHYLWLFIKKLLGLNILQAKAYKILGLLLLRLH